MSKYTVTIETSLPKSKTYLGQPKYLIMNEEKSPNQILNLILSYPIFLFDLKINSEPALAYTYPWPPMPRKVIEVIYHFIKFIDYHHNTLTIAYWNKITETEVTIIVRKHQKPLLFEN